MPPQSAADLAMSPVGTKRTNRAGLTMSVVQGEPEVVFRGHQDRFW